MSYRIETPASAAQLLRTLPGHVVLQFGRLLAEVAAELGRNGPSIAKGSPRQFRLEVEDCALVYEVDRRARTVVVVEVRQSEAALAAF